MSEGTLQWTDEELKWTDEELKGKLKGKVPDGSSCGVYRALAKFPGDRRLQGRLMPIEAEKAKVLDALQKNRVCAVQAPTGSGKTLKLPEFLLELEDCSPVLVVQPSNFAAQKLVVSFQEACGWREKYLHL